MSPSAGSSPSLSLGWSVVLSTSLETPTHHPTPSTTSQYVSRSVLACCVGMGVGAGGGCDMYVLPLIHQLLHHYKLRSLSLVPSPLLPLQVQLGNQQTIVGLISFQPQFNYLLNVVVPVLAAGQLCVILLLVAGCCVCLRRKRHTSGDRCVIN